jgi:hypothetical protein
MLPAIGEKIEAGALRTAQLDFEVEAGRSHGDARVAGRHLLTSRAERLSDGLRECLRMGGAFSAR